MRTKFEELKLKFIEEEIARRRELWIEHYIFMSGQKWTDKPPTREEAENAWQERFEAMIKGKTD